MEDYSQEIQDLFNEAVGKLSLAGNQKDIFEIYAKLFYEIGGRDTATDMIDRQSRIWEK